MKKLARIITAISILSGSLALMALQCNSGDSKDSNKLVTALALSGTHCQRVNGYCSDLDSGCGITETHVGWTPWGCPDKNGVPDTGMCCIPINSCVAVGGVCRYKETEVCPEGTGGTVFMDCPQGSEGQCCIPFE